MQSVKIVAILAVLCAFTAFEAQAQYYAPGYVPGYAYAAYAPWSYLNPYGRYYAYAPGYVIGKRSAGFGPSEQAPTVEQLPQ